MNIHLCGVLGFWGCGARCNILALVLYSVPAHVHTVVVLALWSASAHKSCVSAAEQDLMLHQPLHSSNRIAKKTIFHGPMQAVV